MFCLQVSFSVSGLLCSRDPLNPVVEWLEYLHQNQTQYEHVLVVVDWKVRLAPPHLGPLLVSFNDMMMAGYVLQVKNITYSINTQILLHFAIHKQHVFFLKGSYNHNFSPSLSKDWMLYFDVMLKNYGSRSIMAIFGKL